MPLYILYVPYIVCLYMCIHTNAHIHVLVSMTPLDLETFCFPGLKGYIGNLTECVDYVGVFISGSSVCKHA